MKQKLLKAQTELREALNMARANRAELGLAHRIESALMFTEDSILALERLESEGFHAN